jgi:hypothetical protein
MTAFDLDLCASTRIDDDDLRRLFKGPNRGLVPKLLDVIWGLEDYWPMTLRQIYYQAVAALLVSNNLGQYRRIGNICKALREDDILPWRAMEDRARRTTAKRGLSGLEEFLQSNLATALNWRYYHRCHLQGQANYVELTVEKDALAPLVEEVCWPLCTRMSVTKGQPSVTLMQRIAGRMEAAVSRGQTPILLHFGDLDATGVQVPLSMQSTLWRVHGLDVEVVMGGLTPEQVVEHNLPQSIDAAKEDDPNIERWNQRFPGQAPTELDAMHPSILQETVRAALLDCYDDEQMAEQKEKEHEDEEVLKRMRRSMLTHLRTEFPEQMEPLDL